MIFGARLRQMGTKLVGWRKPRPLVFMHIPKTAGTSLMDAIHQGLRPGIDVRGFDRCLFGDFTDWDTLPSPLRANVYLTPQDMPENADAVMGHFAFSTLRARYPRAQTMTLLREPVSRLLSHFVYWRCQTDETLKGSGPLWAARVMIARDTLPVFLQNPAIACQTDNVAVRQLLWPHPLIPDGDFIDPRHDRLLIKEATRRLAQFDYADIIERGGLFTSVSIFLGITLEEKRLNQTAYVPEALRMNLAAQLTAPVMALLVARSRLDLALWQHIAARHYTRAQVQDMRSAATIKSVAQLTRCLAGPIPDAARAGVLLPA